MKYLILSDTHGHINYLKRIVEKESDIKNIIFLGDGINDVMVLKAQRQDLNIQFVAGNIDHNKEIPKTLLLHIKNHKVFACHGDGYFVKMSLLPLRKECIREGYDIALYGHTHMQYYEYYDGLYMFCPGSIIPSSNPFSCYGIIDFTNDTPLFYHKEL